jgi:hypothetical protein
LRKRLRAVETIRALEDIGKLRIENGELRITVLLVPGIPRHKNNRENHPVSRSGCHPSFVRRGAEDDPAKTQSKT